MEGNDEGENFNSSSPKVKSNLEDDAWPLNRTIFEIYLLFTFETLQSFPLGVSKLLIEAVLFIPGSRILMAGTSTTKQLSAVRTIEKDVLRRRSSLLRFR